MLRDPERQAAIAASIAQQFPEQAGDLVAFISETRDLGGIFGLVSILLLLWSGSNLFGTMATVFDRFYGVPDRGFFRQRLVSFLMMAVYAVLITISVASTSLTGLLIGLSEEVLPFEIPNFAFVVGWAVALLSAILMFLALYRIHPECPHPGLERLEGRGAGGRPVCVAHPDFPLYLHYSERLRDVQGARRVSLLMTWFFFLAMILFAGALLNAILSGHCPVPAPKAEATGTSARRPASAARVVVWAGQMVLLGRARRHGDQPDADPGPTPRGHRLARPDEPRAAAMTALSPGRAPRAMGRRIGGGGRVGQPHPYR